MLGITTIRRAFSSNLQTIRSSDREREKLAAHGIEHPTIQNYMAWRRSILLLVLLCTSLSIGLALYQEFFDSSERPDLLSTVEERINEVMQSELNDESGHTTENLPSNEEEEEEEEEDTEKHSAEALSHGDSEEVASNLTMLGHIENWAPIVSLLVLLFSAALVILNWPHFRRTHNWIVLAFAFSFMLPMLIALCPWSWTFIESSEVNMTAAEKRIENMAYGIAYGADYLVTLLPTVLALVPGVQRACLRVKTLFPQSILPGWILVTASPFYAMVLLVVFVAANQVLEGASFFIGMVLLILAPLIYCLRADVVTKPLANPTSFQTLRTLQRIVGFLTLIAAGLLFAYVMSIDIQGIKIIGLSPENSLLQPLELSKLIMETIGKSMFITVLGADILMRMNLSAWKNLRLFSGTEEANHYDVAMQQMDHVASPIA